MIPTTQRRYQTVEQALKVINDAEKFGGSVKVNKSGDLERSNSSTNPPKELFSFFSKNISVKNSKSRGHRYCSQQNEN